MKLIDYINEINETNYILVAIVLVCWVVIRRWLNRKLEPFLKRKDWLFENQSIFSNNLHGI